ncbi:MAG: hypothetical protein J3K34DRAFT_413620 [Monoraphidium minutum]|nr:MAG: hypothetical protein J3K34DRAFT_413620 [Monoraphidium minutum]
MLTWHVLMTGPGWRGFFQRTPLLAERPTLALVQTMVLVALFWTMQASWFPMRQQRASLLLHAAICAGGIRAARPLACAVRADPRLAAAAGGVCHGLQVAKQLGLAGAGGVGAALGGGAPVCAAAPVEVCIVFSNTLGFLLPFYILWLRNVALRARFKAERQAAREPVCPPRSSGGRKSAPSRGREGGGGRRPGAESASDSGSEGTGAGAPARAAGAGTWWLDAAAGVQFPLALYVFGGVSVLLFTLVIAEAAVLLGLRLC